MSRRRVLHLADSPYLGGITSHILSIAEAFRDDPDWEIVLATLPGKRDDDTMIRRAELAGFDVSTIAMSSTFDMTVRARLRNFVDVNHITAVHTHAYRANVIANLSRLSVPIMTTSHGLAVQPSLRLWLWQSMHLRFMRNQRDVIACSEFVSKRLRSRGVSAGQITVVLNACPDAERDPVSMSRSELNIEPNAIIALYVGRLDAGKRLDTLIAALERQSKYHLLIVGDGPAREALERQVNATGVNASFAGATADPSPYYALADLVVLPTQMEALPMTLIEAAAHGIPSIASSVGGVPEVVEDGVTGILVGEADEWAGAMNRVADAETRTSMGRAARERHRERFSLELLRRSLAEVYSRATAR